MLFTAPEDQDIESKMEELPKMGRGTRVKKLIDTSLRLKTIDRLALSILQYGDEVLHVFLNICIL